MQFEFVWASHNKGDPEVLRCAMWRPTPKSWPSTGLGRSAARRFASKL